MRKNQSQNRGILRDWIFHKAKEWSQGARVRSVPIPVNPTCRFGVALRNFRQLALLRGGVE